MGGARAWLMDWRQNAGHEQVDVLGKSLVQVQKLFDTNSCV